MHKRDGGWSLCGSCGRQRTWAGDADPGCDCPGEGAMVVAYEAGDFSIGVDPSFGKDYTATSILDYHTLGTPTAADLLRAARRAEESGAVLVIDGEREPWSAFLDRMEERGKHGPRFGAMSMRTLDALREALDLVPTPVIEEARPMNRAQRRAKMRRGGR